MAKGHGINVDGATVVFPSGHCGDNGLTEKVESELGFWEELVPKEDGECVAKACKDAEEVSYEGTDSLFGNVVVIDVRREI